MGEIIIDDTQLARDYCATLDAGVQYYTNLVTELRSARDKISANWEGDAAAIYDVISRIDQITSTIDASIVPAMSGLSVSIVNLANELDKVTDKTVDEGGNTNGGTQINGDGDGSQPTTTTPTENGNGAGNVIGGTLTGAGIGAAIGSIIPGIGTAIGAGIGAAIGGVSGGVGAAVNNNTFEDAFWSKHGDNFADAWTSRSWTDQWDYSECEGVIDAVAQTADGLIGTATDVVGAVVDTAGAAVNFIVDGAGELVEALFSW